MQAKKSYDRSAAIKKANPQLVADEQIEQLRTTVDVNAAMVESAKHAVDQAQAGLNDAKSSLQKTTLYAPMSGRVTRLVVEQGETAVPGTFNKDAATLLTISDMSVLETRVKVDETDVARIKIGDSAQVQIDAFPDTTFVGRVTKISNSSVKAATATTRSGGRLRSDDPAPQRPDRHPPGLLGHRQGDHRQAQRRSVGPDHRADRPRERGAARRATPRSASARPSRPRILGKKDVEGVFVVGTDNKVTFRPVKVGIAGEKHFEILSGLKDGEKIVAGTYQAIRELKDGALVREPKVDAKKPTSGTKS